MTAKDPRRSPDDGKRRELVEGEMAPARAGRGRKSFEDTADSIYQAPGRGSSEEAFLDLGCSLICFSYFS